MSITVKNIKFSPLAVMVLKLVCRRMTNAIFANIIGGFAIYKGIFTTVCNTKDPVGADKKLRRSLRHANNLLHRQGRKKIKAIAHRIRGGLSVHKTALFMFAIHKPLVFSQKAKPGQIVGHNGIAGRHGGIPAFLGPGNQLFIFPAGKEKATVFLIPKQI